MSAPRVIAVAPTSPATKAGIVPGDEFASLNGLHPRDVIEYQRIADSGRVRVELQRPGQKANTQVTIDAMPGEPLGIEVSSAVFDRVRTCDNHCAFCFIYQLPKGMRKSLYQKDDDYRLSFLYGNFTTLTRFTELDAERVIDEHLSPLFVSIHATDPTVRASMLRNPKGATSLRWLRFLLDQGIEIHGQVVVCPGINDGAVFEDTCAGILDQYSSLASVGVVPLGISDFSHEESMRAHSVTEAGDICDVVDSWQETFKSVLGRRMIYAADEYYLLAKRSMPLAASYDGYPQHENGIGMSRALHDSFYGDLDSAKRAKKGFFASVDGAPAEGYRAPRVPSSPFSYQTRQTTPLPQPVTVLTSEYGAQVIGPLLDSLDATDLEVLPIKNEFFGGNIAVAGLLTGTDIKRALDGRDMTRRYLLPDACLSNGVFLDGTSLSDLPGLIEAIPTDGASLRQAVGNC